MKNRVSLHIFALKINKKCKKSKIFVESYRGSKCVRDGILLLLFLPSTFNFCFLGLLKFLSFCSLIIALLLHRLLHSSSSQKTSSLANDAWCSITGTFEPSDKKALSFPFSLKKLHNKKKKLYFYCLWSLL